MAIPRYFAMTAAEIRGCSDLPPGIAWMACHFSPYSTGLSNLPQTLPPGSLLILNDRTPIHGHDPRRISEQLSEVLESNGCPGLLMDFQRPGEPETADLAAYLAEALPCPTAVSEPYAVGLTCPVFLPPVPPDTSLTTHLFAWQGRSVWLELALEGQIITLTENGAATVPMPSWEAPAEGLADTRLHCHYQVHPSDTEACFTLWRTKQDLKELLQEAEDQGIQAAVGLYQELKTVEE